MGIGAKKLGGETVINSAERTHPWTELWNGDYYISMFIETPVHLIFHGVLADVIDVIHDFFADHRMTKGFERRVTKFFLT